MADEDDIKVNCTVCGRDFSKKVLVTMKSEEYELADVRDLVCSGCIEKFKRTWQNMTSSCGYCGRHVSKADAAAWVEDYDKEETSPICSSCLE